MKDKHLFISILVVFFITMGLKAQPTDQQQDSTKRSLSGIIQSVKTKISQEKFQLEMSEEDIIKKVDSLPAFSIYKDNYFVTGISLDEKINGETADAKFQISFRHRLTTSRLPFNTFLYLTYTQKSFWNIYKQSAPFKDNNYNPGIGLGRYIIANNKLTGAAFVQLEHESNGRNDEDSRDINFISFSGKYFFSDNLFARLKVNVPFIMGKGNEDLPDYRGTSYLSVDYRTKNDKWWFSGMINPKLSVKSANATLTAGYKVSDKFNQYFFGELYSGTGDSMLDYKRYDLKLRVGIGIKPDFYNAF